MATSVYQLNKGINQPILFRGLKAQYIGYLAAGLVALLLLFAGMYLAGVPIPIGLGTILVSGAGLFTGVYRLSHTYGEHGLLKRMARYRVPATLRIRSRRPFLNLTDNTKQTTHDKDN
ncbi:DUF4133 domain-containing protein [Pontibacter sp. Tf4]|uniref:DUF4133 domain-containing protein n=1 Tax=Pontibacter sp. Tf4 TaxID=2761620 RepID=UPI00162946E8|nr:DUF4133 domain-containing protein [Pontibacter sp. Tf4]MBB6611810.1 DUF4133 domain-containing protein [Pontibacter sp. Tf4]